MSLQEVKDIYLFGIVLLLVTLDVIFMLPTTIISSAVLRREEEEISGDKVGSEMINCYKLLCLL